MIERATREPVKMVDSLRLALAALRAHEFVAVVGDENLLECSPDAADALAERLDSAIPVFLDMACMRAERVSKHVVLAIRRRDLEYKTARELAMAELQSELNSEVTGLLISLEIAMKTPNVPVHVSESLATVLDSARRIRKKRGKHRQDSALELWFAQIDESYITYVNLRRLFLSSAEKEVAQ